MKLKMKDIATIGIFSALLFVVTMLIGAVTGMSMSIYMFSCPIIALISGPLFMLIMAKVHKKGAVLLSCVIVGVLWALMGGIYVLIWEVVLGIVGEVLASRSEYKDFKMLTVSYALYAYAYYLGAIAPLYYATSYYYTHGYTEEATNALIAASRTPAAYIAIPLIAVAAVVSAILSKKMLAKHFEKAGVI